MMCLGDHSTFTLTSALTGQHDGSSPLFFWRTCCLPGVCVCLQELKLSPPPPIFSHEDAQGLGLNCFETSDAMGLGVLQNHW
jgi:hypothetical protein